MKFGKSYMETLASPSFPQEWREGAIEYKHLKKLINGVVAELESLGLGADVLRDLMVPPADESSRDDREEAEDRSESEEHPSHGFHLAPVSRSRSQDGTEGSSAEDCELCTQSFLQHKAAQARNPSSAAVQWVSSISHAEHSKRRAARRPSRLSNSGRRAAASPRASSSTTPDDDDDDDGKDDDEEEEQGENVEVLRPPFQPLEDTSAVETSSADEAGSRHYRGIGKKDLEQLRRASSVGRQSSPDHNGKVSVSSSTASDPDRIHDWSGHGWRERARVNPLSSTGVAKGSAKGKWVQGKGGRRARAEYELGGTKEHPVPRIRLYVESPVQSDEEKTAGDEADWEGESDGEGESEEEEVERIKEVPSSPTSTIRPLQGQVRSPVIRPEDRRASREMRRREIVIPLTADTEFLDTLTGALANLSSLQTSQREAFVQSTESLCRSVARVSSPYATQNDLYVWREIFGLWCEFQIFESQREKDRGELSVDESEARLKRFAEEMAKRGWTAEAFEMDDARNRRGGRLAKLRQSKSSAGSSALPMKDRQSVEALTDFLNLNLALLDVKKFQRVNVEAARKILKKHDKRTALTASSDFGTFMAEQERVRVGATAATAATVAGIGLAGLVDVPSTAFGPASSSSALIGSAGRSATHPSLAALLPSSTTALLSQSLPHILLSLLTTTLLPILPSIDDYSCAICTGVAWRPIQLDCSHLFCIRCLVKLQKRAKADCPLCRAKGVVASADGKNMDEATVNFIKAWFPIEVSEKDRENESDRRKEEMQELGLAMDSDKCVLM